MHKIIFSLSEDEIRNIDYTIWPISFQYPAWFRARAIKQFTKELMEIDLQFSSKSDSNFKE